MKCLLTTLSIILFALPAFAADLGTDAQKAAGEALYEKHCTQCHGAQGDGKGIAYMVFRPQPRDFTRGKYKVRSTGSGELPTDQDIVHAIRKGLAFKTGGAFTSMPPWPNFTDDQVMNLVYYLKSFSSDFTDPEYNNPKVLELPKAPAYSEESAKKGRKVFEDNDCIKCHGNVGRANGPSSPTLEDDWKQPIRAADLTKPWTFRAGSSREDVFRTVSTGFNGTPMPAYDEALGIEQRWDLVNYIASIAQRPDASYDKTDQPVVVSAVDGDISLDDFSSASKLFENSRASRIAIVGQVIEPGRSFFPGINELEVRAIYNKDDLAVMVRWNDMMANTAGENAPNLEVPSFDFAALTAPAAAEEEGDPFGEDEEEDPFGEEEEDPFAEEEDPFADSGDEGGTAAAVDNFKYADALGLQFPTEAAEGNSFVKPYFLFGDSKNPVHLWYRHLGKDQAQVWQGQGSGKMKAVEGAELLSVVHYEEGVWSVIFKRKREIEDAIAFNENSFVPIAFTVWDGVNEERGNKRGVTSWYSLYIEPMKKESPIGPMLMFGGGLLIAELLLIGFVRRRNSNG